MTINVTISIDAPDSASFAAEWARVIPLLLANPTKDVVVDAEDKVVATDESGQKVTAEVVEPPKKPSGRKPKAVTIEAAAQSAVEPEPVQTDIEDAIAETKATEAEQTAAPEITVEVIRAKVKEVFDNKGEDAARDLFKKVGVKNATGVIDAGKGADYLREAAAVLAA